MSSGTPAEPRDVSGPAGAGTGRPGHDQAREQLDLLYLRQFFYQCPVGLLETDDAGAVRMVNPAAVNMLAPVIGSGDLSQLFPLLGQLAPGMIDVISRDPSRMGPLAAGQGMLIRAGAHGEAYLEMQAVRVAAGRVMVVLQDVSAERQLALRAGHRPRRAGHRPRRIRCAASRRNHCPNGLWRPAVTGQGLRYCAARVKTGGS